MQLESEPRRRRLLPFRMSRLIGRWSVGAVFIFLFIKFLQFLKWCGVKSHENGWRKAGGVFMRTDSSKFMLTAFRLTYWTPGGRVPDNFDEAKKVFLRELYDYYENKPDVHWAIRPGLFRMKQIPCPCTDFVEAVFGPDGRLLSAIPHFDPLRGNDLSALDPHDLNLAIAAFIKYHNRFRNLPDTKRRLRLYLSVRRHLITAKWRNVRTCLVYNQLLSRLMTAGWIIFEDLSGLSEKEFARRRIATPNMRIYRHPGFGLLQGVIRFSSAFREADLWIQYHHVPVDGLPMQEHLEKLGKLWGKAGPMLFPAAGSSAARPEIFYSGNRLFRARVFADFTPFLKLRSELNARHAGVMRGGATVAGMILWGMSRMEPFRNCKMMFPVDCPGGKGRELSMIFLRPSEFTVSNAPVLESFFYFQREFNRQLLRTRAGISESHEVLELYAITHPIFYHIAKMLMPNTLSEIVGSVGFSILRDAEIFTAATSDIQADGFIAFGSMNLPTTSGAKTCAVSICGRRREIRTIIEAVNRLAADYRSLLVQNEEGDFQS